MGILNSIHKWAFGREIGKPNPKYQKPTIVGDWRSNLIEENSSGKTHYRVNNLNGLIEVLDKIEYEGGKGSATINWWVSGLHFKLSASVPLEILNDLKKEALDY